MNSWHVLETHGTPPSARCNHASARDDASKSIFVYGGWRGVNEAPLADLHRFDVATRTWHAVAVATDVTPGAVATATPSARSAHTLTPLTERRLLAFGGVAGTRYLQDLQLFNVVASTWQNVYVGGESPPARAKHSLTALHGDDKVVLFGGGDDSRLLNDVWLFDANQQVWSRPRVRGPPPVARWGHSAVRCGDRIVVHGGWNGRSRLADVHMLDTRNMCWVFMSSLMTATDAKVGAVAGHVACALSDHQMLVWGGGDGQLVDDSAVFDVAQCKWTILPHSTPVRCAHTLDVVGEQLYCFGGGDGVKLFNDVLVPSFDPAVRRDTLAETFTALCASTAPAPVVAERPNVRRSLVMPHSPTLRARSPLAASALPAACGDAPPQWAVAVGLGKYYAAMKREEIDESLLRHLTADHLALIGVSDGHERFAVLQSIHSTYGVDPRDSATQLLTMQIEHASLAANRAAVQVAEAVQRVQQQRQTEPQTELQQQQSKTESNDAVAA